MSTTVRSYAFEDMLCLVGPEGTPGVPISGWDTDGGLEFEFPEDMVSHEAGAAGEVFLSKNSDQRVTVNITVRQGTRGALYLGGLLVAADNASSGIPKHTFFMKSFSTGEIVRSSKAVFIGRPTPNQQAESSERVFQMLLPDAAGKIVYGLPF